MAREPMGPSDAPNDELTDFTRRMWVSAAAAVPRMILTMGALIGLGVGASRLCSLVATFAPGVFPAQYRTGAGVGTCHEAASVIIALVFVGPVRELRVRPGAPVPVEKTEGDRATGILPSHVVGARNPAAGFSKRCAIYPPERVRMECRHGHANGMIPFLCHVPCL
jgi:hypothetical protein